MNMIISFSGRENGNCDSISEYIASKDDSIIYFRNLNVHECSRCKYECFKGRCKYRQDDIYNLYESMLSYDKIFFIVPMYCGILRHFILNLMSDVKISLCITKTVTKRLFPGRILQEFTAIRKRTLSLFHALQNGLNLPNLTITCWGQKDINITKGLQIAYWMLKK